MSYVSVPREAFDSIHNLKSTYPEISALLDEIESSLNLRLWNQLSDDLIVLTGKDELQNSSDLISLYNALILHVENTFNPMKLILIIQNVIKNFSSKNIVGYRIRKQGGSNDFLRESRDQTRSKRRGSVFHQNFKRICLFESE